MTNFDRVILDPHTITDTCPTCGGGGEIDCWTDFVDYTTGTRGEVVVTCPNCHGAGETSTPYVAYAYFVGLVMSLTLEGYEAWLESLDGDDDIRYLAHVYENAGHLLPHLAY